MLNLNDFQWLHVVYLGMTTPQLFKAPGDLCYSLFLFFTTAGAPPPPPPHSRHGPLPPVPGSGHSQPNPAPPRARSGPLPPIMGAAAAWQPIPSASPVEQRPSASAALQLFPAAAAALPEAGGLLQQHASCGLGSRAATNDYFHNRLIGQLFK